MRTLILPPTTTKRILILMSHTGGGHRAVADALRDALRAAYGRRAAVTIVDVFRHGPFPVCRFPEIYRQWVRFHPHSYGGTFRMLDSGQAASQASRLYTAIMRRSLERIFAAYPADVVVCTHSILVRMSLNVLRETYPEVPFVTCVTDLVDSHMLWFDPRADQVLLPTQPAYERAAAIPEARRVLTGLPVSRAFFDSVGSKSERRRALGWEPDFATVLLVSGKDGTGSLFETAQAIHARGVGQLVVVAGLNTVLYRRLRAHSWRIPVQVYGYVNNMPSLMHASDAIVTKAGPSSLMEACAAGLPIVISGAIPFQETGNMHYIVEKGAGVFAPQPSHVAEVVSKWLADDALRDPYAQAASKLSRSEAAALAAREIWDAATYG